MYREVLRLLTYEQIRKLLTDTFGVENAKYHTLDEIPLYKLLAVIPKVKCAKCGKEFIPDIDGGKQEDDGSWLDLDCYWNSE